MSAAPTVTVIVPVYDGAAFLPAAVESLHTESKGRLRAVLIDDGSTDGSPDLIRRLAADRPWIRAIFHDGNRGVAAARNAGLRAADTPLIAFIDQDDIWAEGKLDAQFAALAADPALDFVVGHQIFRVAPGLDRPGWAKERYFDGPQAGYVFGTLLAHRHCFERTGPLREDLRYGTDDVDWFARARTGGLRHVMLDRVLLHRTVHDRNHSRMTRQQNAELLRVMHADINARRRQAGERG